MNEPRWADHPRPKDFRAADSYLTLRYEPAQAARLCRKLREADAEPHRVDDLLRACRLEPLPGSDPRVQNAAQRLIDGKPLPPPLLVATSRGADLANGYHHLSLIWHSDPATPVPVFIARDF